MFRQRNAVQPEESAIEEQRRMQNPRRSLREKKEMSMIKTYEDPVLPKLCKILFLFMLIITAAMLLVDLNAFIRYDTRLGMMHLLLNLSTTGFLSWGIFTVLLSLFSVLGISLNKWKFYRQKKSSGIEEKTEEDRQRNRRAVRRLNSSYLLYLKISLIGIAVWGLFYLLFVMI